MVYLTYNDVPSGIYNSQVIDVVKYFNSIQQKEKTKLVALISIRNYFENRKKIKQQLPESTVLPMVPGVTRWKSNVTLLSILNVIGNSEKIMARGPFAASLALKLRETGKVKSVIFDARGAYKAELSEYNVIDDAVIKSEIASLEQDVLRRCDKILAVSDALVNYWKSEYNFVSAKHVIIPCTLSENFNKNFPKKHEIAQIKKDAGFEEQDIVIVYSGSSAGWQSFSLAEQLLESIMERNEKIKLLWLSNDFNRNSDFVKKFVSRIKTNWLKPSEVRNYLLAADYGILFREQSVTNKVASPVKFAEYLSCGLKIIISNNLGDFSDFVKEHQCGVVGDDASSVYLISYEEKVKNHELAMKYLMKENFTKQYLSLIE